MSQSREQRLNIKHTRGYLLYHFGKTKGYDGFDKKEQKRCKRSFDFYDMFDDGVYKDDLKDDEFNF